MTNKYVPEGEFFPEDVQMNLQRLENAMRCGEILSARAVMCDSEQNLHVELGKFKGIIPKSEAAYSPSGEAIKDIAIITRVGKNVCFKVIDFAWDEEMETVILSRKQAQRECCENYISHLRTGDVVDAVVTHMEPFGAFCDIGCGMIALLPVDCISVSRISHPAERFSCGQKIRCVVRGLERDICRLTLSHRELLGTWQDNARLFKAGQTVTGIIRSIEEYGVFVELTPNLAGLAEINEQVSVGQTAAVYIKSIIPEKMKIKLVIVYTSRQSERVLLPECFCDADYISSWRYSPEGAAKIIETVFSESD